MAAGEQAVRHDPPPVLGVVGRLSREVSLELIGNADGATLTGYVGGRTEPGASGVHGRVGRLLGCGGHG